MITRRVPEWESAAKLSTTLPDGDYAAEVSDTGCGMSVKRGRVFDLFFTTKSAGRGLARCRAGDRAESRRFHRAYERTEQR